MPVNVKLPFETIFQQLVGIINFWLCYYNFSSGLIGSLLSLVPLYVMRVVYHNDEVAPLVVNFLISCIFHSLNLLFVHLVMMKLGMSIVDVIVLRMGNEKLLDGLEEGVIIVDEDSDDILYYNASAVG